MLDADWLTLGIPCIFRSWSMFGIYFLEDECKLGAGWHGGLRSGLNVLTILTVLPIYSTLPKKWSYLPHQIINQLAIITHKVVIYIKNFALPKNKKKCSECVKLAWCVMNG